MNNTSLTVIRKRIRLLTTNVAKINDYVQETAILIVLHAQEHGDCNEALNLVKALPQKSSRRGELIKWFAEVSPIGMDIEKGKVGLKSPSSKTFQPFNINKARAIKWFDRPNAVTNADPVTFESIEKNVIDFFARLNKRIEANFEEGTDIRLELKNKVRKAAEAFKTVHPVETKKPVEAIAPVVELRQAA